MTIKVPKSKMKRIEAFLKKEGINFKMRKGNYKKGEKPSDFAGAWADRKENEIIDADELRRRAWGGRGVN